VNPLLEVHDLTAGYGNAEVLKGLNFSLLPGGIAALLGANGAGKTTTLRALCGMVRRRGEIIFDGRSIVRLATEDIVRLGIAHVPDGRGTFVRRTVKENLQLGAMVRRDYAEIAEDIDRVYAYFPKLKQRHSQQAGTLSGGEQQMLAIGRALMLRPRMLLLDEPSFGLAPKVVQELFNTLGRLNKEQGISLLLVEQNAEIALGIASNVSLIEMGSIVFSGASDEVRNNESIRRSYLGY
jgi:branched-chain amino acid transport system ATP-binding protein